MLIEVYADGHLGLKRFMLSVVMLNVVTVSVGRLLALLWRYSGLTRTLWPYFGVNLAFLRLYLGLFVSSWVIILALNGPCLAFLADFILGLNGVG